MACSRDNYTISGSSAGDLTTVADASGFELLLRWLLAWLLEGATVDAQRLNAQPGRLYRAVHVGDNGRGG